MRAGRSVLSTCEAMFFPPRGRREPTGKAASGSPHSATTVTVASASYLTILMFSTPRSPATSLATAAETSDGDDSCATSVATRRSAACSSARRLASARASVFEIAVANSSVNWASRVSVSSGNGSSRVEAATATPHTTPSTTIGTPTADRIASCRASSTNGPSSGSSIGPRRTARPSSRIDRSSSSTGRRAPIGNSASAALQAATSVTVSSASKRIKDVGSAPTSQPTSSMTAANSSSCDTPRATSVATRRSAACSSAIFEPSARDGTFTTSSRSAPSAA